MGRARSGGAAIVDALLQRQTISCSVCSRGSLPGGGERCVRAKERAAGWRRACEYNANSLFGDLGSDSCRRRLLVPLRALHQLPSHPAPRRARMNKWLWRRLPLANDWERVRRGLWRRKNKKDSVAFVGRNLHGWREDCRRVDETVFWGATTPPPPPLGTGDSASVVPGGASAVPVVDGIGASIVCDAGKT
jgi:hypothetical protein